MLALLVVVFFNSVDVTTRMRDALKDDGDGDNDKQGHGYGGSKGIYRFAGELLLISMFLDAFGLFSSFLAWMAMSVANGETIANLKNNKMTQIGLYLPMFCVLLSITATTCWLTMMLFLVQSLDFGTIILSVVAIVTFAFIIYVYLYIIEKPDPGRPSTPIGQSFDSPTEIEIQDKTEPLLGRNPPPPPPPPPDKGTLSLDDIEKALNLDLTSLKNRPPLSSSRPERNKLRINQTLRSPRNRGLVESRSDLNLSGVHII